MHVNAHTYILIFLTNKKQKRGQVEGKRELVRTPVTKILNAPLLIHHDGLSSLMSISLNNADDLAVDWSSVQFRNAKINVVLSASTSGPRKSN